MRCSVFIPLLSQVCFSCGQPIVVELQVSAIFTVHLEQVVLTDWIER